MSSGLVNKLLTWDFAVVRVVGGRARGVACGQGGLPAWRAGRGPGRGRRGYPAAGRMYAFQTSRATYRLRLRTISLRVLPSLVRLSRYAWVRGSYWRRLWTMRHSAEFACRSPPWLRRCRCCLPEEQSTGETPHSAARLDSRRIRAGLSPAVMISAAADCGPAPALA